MIKIGKYPIIKKKWIRTYKIILNILKSKIFFKKRFC